MNGRVPLLADSCTASGSSSQSRTSGQRAEERLGPVRERRVASSGPCLVGVVRGQHLGR